MVLLKYSPRWLAAVALIGLALPAQAAEVNPYLPNDTEAVLTVNVRQILDSSLVQKHALELIKGFLKGNDQVQKVLESLGFDPLTDVTSLTVAGPGGTSQDNKGLIVVNGKFDLEKFRGKAEEVAKEESAELKILTKGGYTLYETKAPESTGNGAGKPMYIGLVDETALAASGNPDYVVEAMDKKAGKKKMAVKKEVEDLVTKEDAGQSLWFVALGDALGKSPLGNSDETKELVEKITTVTGGLTVASDFKLGVHINAKDEAAAGDVLKELKKDLEQLKGLVAFFASDKKELAPVQEALETLKLTTKGSQVNIDGHISSEMIEKALTKKAAE